VGRRPKRWKILQSSKREALLAVELYNRPYGERYLEAHIVHMHLAWLYLLHAHFESQRIDYRYRDKTGRYVRNEDGTPRTWELAECIRHWKPNEADPVRKNLEFFIGLRNRIEHQSQHVVEAVVAGRIQSNVVNYEDSLVELFGQEEGLGSSLRLPIFLSTVTEDAAAAVKKARDLLPTTVRTFIEAFDGNLPEEILGHPKFDLRILLIPKVGSKTEADAALEFVRFDALTQEEKHAIDQLQKVIVRERQVPVLLKDYLKPSAVARQVQAAIPFRFTAATHHARCWQHFDVRPPSGDVRPERTDARYCVYSEPHAEYVYTPAWVNKLIAELATANGFSAVTGYAPVPK
jgi:hypothetical protein